MNDSVKATRIMVKVQPGAHRSELAGLAAGVWKIKIAAPADKGKANRELIDFLSDKLDVPKAGITILKGLTSHNKTLLVQSISAAEIETRLASQ
jgi:uncharacterized protein